MFPQIRTAVAALGLACAHAAVAAPALTTIQDILYRADGARFEGTVTISWTNFESPNGSPIGTQAATLPIINGVIKVQLTPTTAYPGASYAVRYNSQGRFQFTETWAVPPSTTPLRIRDVRVGAGSIIGPPPVISPISITDVTGLTDELSARPAKSPAFASSRAAVVDSMGRLASAAGNPSDCVRVDGTSGPCGEGGQGGGYFSFADNETPSGLVDGSSATFRLAFSPTPASSLMLFFNGMRMKDGVDYSLSGDAITFVAGAIPSPGDVITASYRYADPSNPAARLAPPQVVCAATGTSTNSTTATTLGSCTVPAGVLQRGDRVEIRFDYSHEGATAPFNVQVLWGQSATLSRGGDAEDQVLTGRIDAAPHAAGTQWSAMSWGTASALGIAAAAGTAPDDLSGPITISFTGQLTTAGSDTVSLRSFAVIRYPAQQAQ